MSFHANFGENKNLNSYLLICAPEFYSSHPSKLCTLYFHVSASNFSMWGLAEIEAPFDTPLCKEHDTRMYIHICTHIPPGDTYTYTYILATERDPDLEQPHMFWSFTAARHLGTSLPKVA